MTGDAVTGFLRHVKGIQIRIVINGVAAGVFHIDRRTGAVANQQGAVDVAHQVRTGGHIHYRFIHAGVRVEAGEGAPLLTFQVRNVDQRGPVRHPKFMCTAFTFRVRFHFPHVAAIFVHQPHAGVDQVVRPFMTEGHGIVIERAIYRMSQPDLLVMNGGAFTRFQINAQQAAVRPFVEEVVENFPVVEWRPVTSGNLNTHQFGAVAVRDPGAVADPLFRYAVHFALCQRL